LVTILEDPDRVILQAADEYGTIHISYTVSPPTITTQPADTTVRAGQRARFSVVASGTPPLHFQWTKNGVNITGATRASYTTPPATLEDNGSLFAATVTNGIGSVTSNNATLTVH
jgi:hypothetical protein